MDAIEMILVQLKKAEQKIDNLRLEINKMDEKIENLQTETKEKYY
ncbi:MAG: hypothetical protein Q4A78_03530 [Peptostreptococcaceae bacterium]|nr:hypothetical protein [Peptostreptococcaceae bacterium]